MEQGYCISGKTEVYAVIGKPVAHSLSPLIHNSAFQSQELDKVYIALTVEKEELGLAVEMVRSFGLKGLNVTMPLKEALIPYLDSLSPEARIIGAVNCVQNSGGVLQGFNTDSTGFGLSLKRNSIPDPSTAFLLGAGGAAKAIAVQLVIGGVQRLYITNRSAERAEELAEKLRNLGQTEVWILPWSCDLWQPLIGECDLIVNATALGMGQRGDLGAMLPWSKLRNSAAIYETVYEPLRTTLVNKASELGFKAIPGTELLLYQAAKAYEIWTGITPPIEVMRKAMEDFLKRN